MARSPEGVAIGVSAAAHLLKQLQAGSFCCAAGMQQELAA
jgi:hypothetical protein